MKKKSKIPKNAYCRKCPAVCCKNLAMAIGKPKTPKEIADLKWQLHFDTVKVYVHKHHWYQLVEGRCMYLGKDNRCTIYDSRPAMCRKHNPPNCEMFGSYYDVMFHAPRDLDEYLKKTKKIKSGTRKR
jgi:Fe-S-cluster containining protein